ncbi:MAG: hypothetical protein ACLU6Y_00905 [Ruminococcus sp.]
MIEGMNGERIDLTVTGPMHAPVNAYYGYLKDSNARGYGNGLLSWNHTGSR